MVKITKETKQNKNTAVKQASQVQEGQWGYNVVQKHDQYYSLIDTLSTTKHVPMLLNATKY